MSDWRWTFQIKTGEIITIYTKDNNPSSKTKAIAELARACCGGEGRSEETLLKIGYALQPKLLDTKKELTPFSTTFSAAFLQTRSLLSNK
jgi:hypothetical protein